jgi:hypothetical protein
VLIGGEGQESIKREFFRVEINEKLPDSQLRIDPSKGIRHFTYKIWDNEW